jgi:hypothetical protein
MEMSKRMKRFIFLSAMAALLLAPRATLHAADPTEPTIAFQGQAPRFR